MKRLMLLAAAALLNPCLLGAQPAGGAPDPRFDCLLEGISAEQRMLAASGASQQLTDVPAEDEQRSRTALDAVAANAPRCAASAGWTENQRELALQYTLLQLARDDMIRRYAAQNVDLTFIDEALAAASPEGPVSFEDLAARMRAQGVGDNRPDSAEDIVYIYGMLAAQSAEIRLRFDDQNFRPQ
jgi:hypothetical protein